MAEVLTWQQSTIPGSSYAYSKCIKFKNKYFVFAPARSENKCYVSSDGISGWASVTMPAQSSSSTQYVFAHSESVMIAVSSSETGTFNQYCYTDDGVSWVSSTLPVNGNWLNLVYAGGYFVAAAYSGSVVYSADGIAWTYVNTGHGYAQCLAYGNGTWIISGFSGGYGSNKYSTNLTQWYNYTALNAYSYNTRFAGSYFISPYSASELNYIGISSNGFTWTSVTMPRSKYFSYAIYYNGIYVIATRSIGTMYVYYSYDCITWNEVVTTISLLTVTDRVNLFFSNGYFFIFTPHGTIYSKDSIIWSTFSPSLAISVPDAQRQMTFTESINDTKIMLSAGATTTNYYYIITIPKYSITPDDYFKRYQPSKSEELKNYITVTATPLKMETDKTEVGRSGATLIPTGSTVTVNVYYDDVPCDTDGEYELSNAVDSGYLSYTYCQVVSYQYFPTYASLQIRHNEISGTCNIVVAIKCRKISSSGEQTYNTSNDTSIAKFGKRVYDLPKNHLVQSLANAQTIAVNLLNSYSNFRKDQRIEWRGDPSLILGDTVELTEYKKQNQDIKGEYYQIKNQLTYDGTLRSTTEYRKKV